MGNTKGTLVRWFSNKGFGFIKPEQGGADVFIHITALKGQGRKPVIGDIIHYEISSDTNGKTRAVNASIEGIEQVLTVNPITKTHKPGTFRLIKSIASNIKLIFLSGYNDPQKTATLA